MVCSAFDVARSCYYAHRLRRRRVDARRVALRSRVNELFSQSRGSAGSRSILGMLREDGVTIGRFRVRRLMRELGLVSKQPGSHAYKQATVERPDIPNRLNRDFAVQRPNQVWCGDITYVWAQGRWHYLAAVLDLHTRRVVGWAFSAKPDAELVIKASRWPTSSAASHSRCCSIRIRAASTPAACSGSGYGATGCSRA